MAKRAPDRASRPYARQAKLLKKALKANGRDICGVEPYLSREHEVEVCSRSIDGWFLGEGAPPAEAITGLTELVTPVFADAGTNSVAQRWYSPKTTQEELHFYETCVDAHILRLKTGQKNYRAVHDGPRTKPVNIRIELGPYLTE